MRRVLLETSYIDDQAAQAAKRVALALDLPLSIDTKTTALSAVGQLRLQIRDLQRENACLQYLADNPDFDVDEQLDRDRTIFHSYLEQKHSVTALYNRFDYDHFVDHYHPDYIRELCKFLCEECLNHGIPTNDLWEYLRLSSGFITKEWMDKYGPQECDKNSI